MTLPNSIVKAVDSIFGFFKGREANYDARVLNKSIKRYKKAIEAAEQFILLTRDYHMNEGTEFAIKALRKREKEEERFWEYNQG